MCGIVGTAQAAAHGFRGREDNHIAELQTESIMKTAVVTGASSGIGFAVLKALAAENMRVIGVGRIPENCEKAKAALLSVYPKANAEWFCADLSVQNDVNTLADGILAHLEESGGVLDVLINNAGGVRNGYTETPDGYELQFALNHLAGFLLTHRLWRALQKAGGRVIITGSNSHKHTRMHWRDVMYKKRYNCLWAYKQSKLCNLLFAREIGRRFAGSGVRAYVVDPGLVNTDIGNKQTQGVVTAFWNVRKRYGTAPEVAAQTYAWLSSTEPAPEGLYFYNSSVKAYSPHADNVQDAKRLFELSEKLCGIRFGEEI